MLLILHSEKQRLEHTPKDLHSSIQAVIKTIESQISEMDGQMQSHIDQHYKEMDTLLQSVSGIGPQTSAALIAELPELGQLTRRQIAALVGVAPYAKESGNSKGKRRIQGGRFGLRRTLYMAALVAARYNPVIRDFYQRLRLAGKLAKVALIAALRKLLTIVNAMVRDNKPWDAAQIAQNVANKQQIKAAIPT